MSDLLHTRYRYREDGQGNLFATQTSGPKAPWQTEERPPTELRVPLEAIAHAAEQRASWPPISREVTWSTEELQEQAEARAERQKRAAEERFAEELRRNAKREGKPFYEHERLTSTTQAGTSAARTSEEAQEPEAPVERALVWIDTETGGTSPEHHPLLEIACIQTNSDASKVLSGWFHATVRPAPGQHCTADALRINGHRPTDPDWLANALTIEEAVDLFLCWLPQQVQPVLAGHNVAFDQRFLTAAIARRGLRWNTPTLDTLTLARRLRGTALPAKQKCGLTELCSLFAIDTADQHTAKADCRRAIQLYRRLRDLEAKGSLLAAGGT